jgi:hypothetical protein
MPGFFRSLGGDDDGESGKIPGKMAPVVMPKWRPKYPWCHFTLSTESAPPWLDDLSRSAGLPKEKLVLSYLLATKVSAKAPAGEKTLTLEPAPTDAKARTTPRVCQLKARVVSNPFPLPGMKMGCYACSSLGFTLLEWDEGACHIASGAANGSANGDISQTSGQKESSGPSSGDLVVITLRSTLNRRDEKTGAVVVPI